jgi:hypothetical protein
LSPKNALSGAKLALAALLCAALPAQAGDKTYLRPMLDVEQGWDSNIYNDSGDEQGSLVTRVSPGLWIENSGELGHARLGLTAVGRTVWEESDLSGIDGLLRGDFERRLTPRLSVFGDGLLDQYSGYDEIDDDGPGNQGGLPILEEQPSWKRDQIGAGFSYLLTPRLSMRISGFGGRINYERIDTNFTSEDEYRDRTLFGAKSVLVYQLSALDQISAGVDYDDTEYQDLGTGTNDSAIWSGYLGWTRTWTPVWSSSATIGIRSLDTTQKGVPQSGGYGFYATCELFPGVEIPCPQTGAYPLGQADFSNSGTGLIGSLSIRRAFARSALELSYDRDTRSTGGSGRTNFDIDSFTLAWTQRLAERVKLTLSGNYSLYHSVTDEIPNYAASVSASPSGTRVFCALGGAPTAVESVTNPLDPTEQVPIYQCVGGSSEETREYTTLAGRIEWQMRRKLNAYVVARYYHSITDETLGSRDIQTEDLDKFTFGVGFRYYYDLRM